MGVRVALLQIPCRSGSPHGVRGGVHLFAVPAAFGAWAMAGPAKNTSRIITARQPRKARRGVIICILASQVCPDFALELVGCYCNSQARSIRHLIAGSSYNGGRSFQLS